MDAERVSERQRLRSTTVTALSDLVNGEHMTEASITSTAVSASSISQSTFELTNEDADTLQQVSDYVIGRAIIIGYEEPEDLISILATADSIASMTQYNYRSFSRSNETVTVGTVRNATVSATLKTVSKYVALVQNVKVVGEPSSVYLYANFNVHVSSFEASGNLSVTTAGSALSPTANGTDY